MSISDSLRLFWVDGLTRCKHSKGITTERLFSKQNATFSALVPSGAAVYVGNAKLSLTYFAHEADRFASASFESLRAETKCVEFPRSIGWLLIKGYYAAFFAAHALMRIHGWACTRLSVSDLESLNDEIRILHSNSPRLKAGLYLIKSENGGSILQCEELASLAGGTHDILWKTLDRYFEELTTTILSSDDTDAQELANAVGSFRKTADKFGGLGWFSKVRNRINYSHEYGAWFPYLKSTCDYDRIRSAFLTWQSPPNKILDNTCNDELIKFSYSCAFLVSICRTTVADLTNRSNSASPFRKSSGLLVRP
jgi:hypothetical protein